MFYKSYIALISIMFLPHLIWANPIYKVSPLYEFINRDVKVKDIIAINSSTIVFVIPSGINIYKISHSQLKQLFAKQDITITFTNPKKPYVIFKKKLTLNKTPIKQFIKEKYHNYYPDIDIKRILLTTNNYIDTDNYDISKIDLPSHHIKFAKGSIRVWLTTNKDKSLQNYSQKSLQFRYEIDAWITGYITTIKVAKDSPITTYNTSPTRLRLQQTRGLITNFTPDIWYARFTINKGQLLQNKLLKKMPLVKKNSKVQIIFKEGLIEAKTTGIAQSNGYKNQYIRVKVNNQIQHGKILAKNKVVIE